MMRQELSSHQLKPQLRGEITQRALVSNHPQKHLNLYDLSTLIPQRSSLYLAIHDFYHQDYYYRNRKIEPHILIHNVAFRSDILPYSNSYLTFIPPNGRQYAIEILEGENSTKPNLRHGQISVSPIHLFSENISLDSLYRHSQVSLSGTYNANYISGQISHSYRHHAFSNQVSIFGSYNYRYHIGTASKIGSWGYIPYQVSTSSQGVRQWIHNPDSAEYIDKSYLYGLENMATYHPDRYRILQLYTRVGIADGYNLGQMAQNGTDYRYTSSRTSLSPMLLSYLQYIHTSDEARLYTQANMSLSFQSIAQNISEQMAISDSQTHLNMRENVFSLQLNAYKNANARNVLYYGLISSFRIIRASSSDAPILVSFPSPRYDIAAYYRHEYRPSSDISWFLGGNMGLENRQIDFPYYQMKYSRPLLPKIQVNAAWTRHTCENSNYTINLFYTLQQPTLEQTKFVGYPVYFYPNIDLKPANELLLDAHLYRKFDDKLELLIAPYYRYTLHPAILYENRMDSSRQVYYGSKAYFPVEYKNLSSLHELGIQGEIKYHFSSAIMGYSSIHYNAILNSYPSEYLPINLPLYIKSGIRYRSSKLTIESAIQYNGGVSLSSTHSYPIQYGAPLDSKSVFPAYLLWNTSLAYAPVKQITIITRLDNILNTNYRSYLSTIHGLGRNFTLMANFHF